MHDVIDDVTWRDHIQVSTQVLHPVSHCDAAAAAAALDDGARLASATDLLRNAGRFDNGRQLCPRTPYVLA